MPEVRNTEVRKDLNDYLTDVERLTLQATELGVKTVVQILIWFCRSLFGRRPTIVPQDQESQSCPHKVRI